MLWVRDYWYALHQGHQASIKEMEKKKMKKFLSSILILILALTIFSGCGKDGTSSSNDEKKEDIDVDYVITTDSDFAPFEYTNEKNMFTGIDVEILSAIALDQDFTYTLEPSDFSSAAGAVDSGEADAVIAAMSITDERKLKFDFSDSYYDSSICAAVSADSNAASLADIKGSAVAVKTGTQGAAWAEQIAEEYSLELTYFKTSNEMYESVKVGDTAACFEDFAVMTYGVSKNNGLKILEKEAGAYDTPLALAVLKGENKELIEKFNEGLKNIKENGVYDMLIARHINSDGTAVASDEATPDASDSQTTAVVTDGTDVQVE